MSEVALDQSTLPDIEPDLNAPANIANVETQENNLGNNGVPIIHEKSAIERFVEQPAVKRAAPAVIGLLVLYVDFCSWVSCSLSWDARS